MEKIIEDLLKDKSKEEAIEHLTTQIKRMNEDFNIFGFTSEDLKKLKSLNEALKSLQHG